MPGIVAMKTSPETVREANQSDHEGPERFGDLVRSLVLEDEENHGNPAAIRIRYLLQVFQPRYQTIPSTAERILMAGVITPSPKEAPHPENGRAPRQAQFAGPASGA